MKRIAKLEAYFRENPSRSKILHTEVAKAIFARSPKLYSGEELPDHLKRYTYPPVLSIALNSHCNASCFFCRDLDFKGTLIDFDQITKLDSAVRNARVIDLTGWGEPFFYPKFEEVVERICRLNDSPHLIMVTSNGSFLSERWGKLLAGRINGLIVSMNAGSADVYAKQMRYKNKQFTFDSTVASVREFTKNITAADRSRMILHMVANTENYKDMTALVRVASDLGVPTVNIGHFICVDEKQMHLSLLNVREDYNQELSNAKVVAERLNIQLNGRRFFVDEKEVKGAETCMAPFEQFFVEIPGTTAPCCFMGSERMGNVYEDGFEAVWFSNKMNKLRASRYLPACQVCTHYTPFDDPIAHLSAHLTTKLPKPKAQMPAIGY